MLERIIEAAFDKFLETDNEELLELKKEGTDKILNAKELKRIFVEDTIDNVAREYETAAYYAGFMAAVECFKAMTGVSGGLVWVDTSGLNTVTAEEIVEGVKAESFEEDLDGTICFSLADIGYCSVGVSVDPEKQTVELIGDSVISFLIPEKEKNQLLQWIEEVMK